MAVGDVFKFTMVGSGPAGEQLVNVLHYVQFATSGGGSVTAATMDDTVDAFETLIIPSYLAVITDVYTYEYTKLDVLGSAAGPLQFIGFNATGMAGALAVDPGGIERTAIIKKTAPAAGRQGHGRMFVPLVPATLFDVDGRVVPTDPSYVDMGILAVNVTAGVLSVPFGQIAPTIYHRQGGTNTMINAGQVSPFCGVQRRRRFGIGA